MAEKIFKNNISFIMEYEIKHVMIKKETYFNKASFEVDSIKMFDHIFINFLNILYIVF